MEYAQYRGIADLARCVACYSRLQIAGLLLKEQRLSTGDVVSALFLT
ncbi:MAG: hypothetical protein ACI8W8_004149 [Rhodothermales bacterium]|jgi:hypothetical protein